VNTTVELPGIDTTRCNFSTIFANAATDDATGTPQISFGVMVEDRDTNATADLGNAPFSTDTGRVLLQLQKEGSFRAKLQAFTGRSDGRQMLNLTEMLLDVRLPDTYDSVTRVKRGCSGHGVVTEDVGSGGRPVRQNDVYECICNGTWTGHDCANEMVPDPASKTDSETPLIAACAVSGVLAIGVVLLTQALCKRRKSASAPMYSPITTNGGYARDGNDDDLLQANASYEADFDSSF